MSTAGRLGPSVTALCWLALCVACQQQGEAVPLGGSAAPVPSLRLPSLEAEQTVQTPVVLPVPPPPPKPLPRGLPTASSHLNFGLRKSELPALTSYVHERSRPGRPPAAAFTISGASGGGRKPSAGGLLVDVLGGVWRYTGFEDARQYRRLGRVPPSDVSRMRSLAALGAKRPLLVEPGCRDCGGRAVLVHGLRGADETTLASFGESGTEHRDSEHSDRVILWLLAVQDRARDSQDAGPFGLELPLVTELRSSPSTASTTGRPVLELRHFHVGEGWGVVVDETGDVFRFHDYRREPRVFRRVGSVGEASVRRLVRTAAKAATEDWEEITGTRFAHQVRWYGGPGQDEAGVLISDDSEFGGRRVGKKADELIGWMAALDRQAVAVHELYWPTSTY